MSLFQCFQSTYSRINIITRIIRIITANIIFEASDADPRTQRNTYTMNNMAEKQTLTKQKLNNKRKKSRHSNVFGP